MNRFAPFCLAATVALASASAALEQVALPQGFDGLYVPEGEACGSGLEITVKDGVMLVMDGAMSVTDLIESPANPRQVEASLVISGGGEEVTDSAVITLSEDGRSLQFDYADGSIVTWARCD